MSDPRQDVGFALLVSLCMCESFVCHYYTGA